MTTRPPLDDETRRQTACAAAYLLNEAIRELAIPYRLFASTENVPEGPVDIAYLGAVRHTVLQSTVIAVFRVKEIREGFLAGWLFGEDELRRLGLPPVEEFVGGKDKWAHVEIVRHQYAGHPSSRKATPAGPALLIPPEILGRAIRETGLGDLKSFLQRVVEELAPGVQAVRDELARRFPEVEKFVKETYPLAVEGTARDE